MNLPLARDAAIGASQETHHHRLANRLCVAQDPLPDRGGRRFRYDDDDVCIPIRGKEFERMTHRAAADLFVYVAAASADRMRYAGAHLMDSAGHFLEAGPRRADEADVAAPHDIG